MMEIYLDEISDSIPNEFEKYFRFIEHVASGSFGTVMKAINLENNKLIAVKTINKFGEQGNQKNLNKLKQEITILKQIKHRNIVEFYGFVETSQKLYIMMEYIHSGTLKNLFERRKENKFTEQEAGKLLECLFSAVDYLHTREICHRDIKPENIMFENWNDMGTLKLIDFGLSSQCFEAMEQYEFCGTLIYMAPEQIESKIYTKSIDIWSCGIIMYMLLNNGIHPLYKKGDKYNDYVQKLKKPKINFLFKTSRMAKILLLKLLEPDPFRRYSADKALSHPWITRKIDGHIPKTFLETMKANEIRRKIMQVFGAALFIFNILKKDTRMNSGQKIKENIALENEKLRSDSDPFYINDKNENIINPVKHDSTNSKTNLQKFQDYVDKLEKNSEKAKTRLMKIREKCFDVCTEEEYEMFEKEILKSLDYAIKPRNSLKLEKKLSKGALKHLNPDVNNSNEEVIKKRSLKVRRNTLNNKLIETKFIVVNKFNNLGKSLAANIPTITKKQIDNKLSIVNNTIIQNYKTNIADRIHTNLIEGELMKKIEKNLKNTELINARNGLILNKDKNQIQPRKSNKSINPVGRIQEKNYKHLENSNEGVSTLVNKIILNSNKSNRIDKNILKIHNKIDDRLEPSKKSNFLENQINLNKMKHNKSEKFMRKDMRENSYINLVSKNNISKENIFLYINGPKENELSDIKEKNILNLSNSKININFVKVDLPLILPSLPANNNSNTNLNVFRNNKIQKRKSTKKNSLIK